MKLLVRGARLSCQHKTGKVEMIVSQHLVFIQGNEVHVQPDPEQRGITRCGNTGPTIKPCSASLAVRSGYVSWLQIAGRAACSDRIVGRTDGTPPMTVDYEVDYPGQDLVAVR